MLMRFFKAENTNKAILVSILLSLTAKLFNFAQSVVISHAFGTQQSTDILFYMLSLVILVTTFQGAVNEQVIIPTAIQLRKQKSEESSKNFLSSIYFVYVLIGAGVTLLLLLFPSSLLSILSRFPSEAIENHTGMVKMVTMSMFFLLLNTFMLEILVSYRYFSFPMLLDMLKNIFIIVFVIVFKSRLHVNSLALGVFVGNLAQFIVLTIILFRFFRFKLTFKRPDLSEAMKKNIMYVIVGRISTFVNDFIIMYLISGFSPGVYSSMDYALKIDTMVYIVIVGQISKVVGLKIIELYAKRGFDEINRIFVSYLKMGLFVIFPICFMLSMNAERVVSILFQRGNFTAESAALTSGFLRYFVLTIPLEMVNSFIVMLIIAKQIQRVAFLWQIFQNLLNIAIIGIAVSKFGYYGYPIGMIISTMLYILLLSYFLIKSHFEYMQPMEILKLLLSNIFLNGGAAVLLFLFMPVQKTEGSIIVKTVGLVASCASFIVVLGILIMITGINRDVVFRVFKNIKKRLSLGQ